MKNILLGVEIESICNYDIIDNIEIGNYHEGIAISGLPSFFAEEDGSLRYNNEFDNPLTVELVSKCFKGKEAFFKGLQDFEIFFSCSGKYELKKVLYFNSSCGSHLHFSVPNFKFTSKSILSTQSILKILSTCCPRGIYKLSI